MILGTAFIYEDASRPTQDGQLESRRLKYDRSGLRAIILVPQPSDDPNDPLVRKTFLVPTWQTLMESELATLEARLDPRHTVGPIGHCLYIESSACRKHCHIITALRQELYADGARHWLSSAWSRRGRLPFRRLRTSLGQASSISTGYYSHNHLQRLGRCHWDKLRKFVVGKNHSRGRAGAFRSSGQC